MSANVSGIANAVNFRIENYLVTWEQYTFPVENISMCSTGTSERYERKPKKRSMVGSIFKNLLDISAFIDQFTEDDSPEAMLETAKAYELYGDGNSLPCINLELRNGMTFEITFTDIYTFRAKFKELRKAMSDIAKLRGLSLSGEQVNVGSANVKGTVYVLETKSKDNEEDKGDEQEVNR